MVDTSLMEAAIQQTYYQSANYLATGENPGPTGSAHIVAAPYQAFPTADGWINVGGANQSNWERIARTIGREDLLADPRFATNGDRMTHLSELTPLIAERMKTRPSAEWIRELEAAGVPAGPINRIGDMLADPQVAARAMVVEVDHPKAGRTRALGMPIKFSDTPCRVTRASPLLGQHTDEILASLGYTIAEIDALCAQGAVARAG
jgi:crotonobetainyl-CoA:carnitine CoA-transferase CaiB-like acyl-CoA transferase